MKAALEILGIPTWHWVEMAANPPDMDMWSEAMVAKYTGGRPFGRREFDMLLSNWGAITDQPGVLFCEELQQAYPEVKVVLVERDMGKWYKSFCDTVITSSSNPWIPFASKIDPIFMKRTCYQTDLLMKHFFNISEPRATGLFNNPKAFEQWRENARATYQRHNETVKRVTPKEKLLVFRLEDGWEPLCKFLGKPVPNVPFPRLNETEAVNELVRVYIGQSYKRALTRFAKRAVPIMAGFIALVAWWLKG